MLQTEGTEDIDLCCSKRTSKQDFSVVLCNVNVIDYVVPSDWVIVYNELERIWKGAIMA